MQLFCDVQFVDEHGHVHGRIRHEIAEGAAFLGERSVAALKDDLELGVCVNPQEQVMHVLRVKEFRRHALQGAVSQAGAKLCDHLEDREGWHGIDRADRVNADYPKRAF